MQGNPTLVEVMSYLPPAMGSDQLMMERQNTNDLAKAIAKSHQDNLKYAKKIAFLFRGYDDKETARNIFNFIKKYIPYTIEPGERQCTKTLPRMLDDARNGIGSDCKMYSVLTGTILKTLKIPFKYRLAGYSTNYPQHIYCKTDKYTIDAVLPHFNYEKPYNYKKDMALYNLAGIDQIGKLSDWKPKTEFGKFIKKNVDKAVDAGMDLKTAIKTEGGKLLNKGKKYLFAEARLIFYTLVEFNVRGLAFRVEKAYKNQRQELTNKWVNTIGGDMDRLVKAMQKGIKKPPFFGSKIQRISGNIDKIGAFKPTPDEVIKMIVATTGLVAVLVPVFKKSDPNDKDINMGVPPGSDSTAFNDFLKNEGSNGNDEDNKINPLLIVGAGAVALFLLTKKK